MLWLAILNAAIFLTLGVLHFYWALGFTWALDVVVPAKPTGEKMLSPSAAASTVVGLGLSMMAAVHLANARLWLTEFPYVIKYSTMAIAIIFFLRAFGDFKWVGLFKKITTTSFAKNDTRYYVPLCLFLSASSFLLFFLR
ncbi:MAG: DUF3995 domain-containing protein [Cyclobacteriaceae bacterium]|jgi:hypothetical protein|nr:DUF3995 domain-containing protein [Flammeovirgaceae bacterium]